MASGPSRDNREVGAPSGPAGPETGATGGFWNGFVRYAGGKRFAIWAKVRVLAAEPRVIAAAELKPGRPIETAQLRLETREGFPGRGAFVDGADEIVGRALRRGVPAGTAIRKSWLEAPRDVLRGDTVRVVAQAGAARIETEAVAQSSGSAGETILLENAATKRRFRGRVEGKGRVSAGKGDL